MPFPVPEDVTIDALVCRAGSGGDLLMAMYDADANGEPNALVATKTETVSGGEALREMVLATPVLLTAGLYFLAFQGSDAGVAIEGQFGAFNFFPHLAHLGFDDMVAAAANIYTNYTVANTYGAAPDPFPAGFTLQKQVFANVGFRVA